MRTRRKFTDEFKREAVKVAAQPGVTFTSWLGSSVSSAACCAGGSRMPRRGGTTRRLASRSGLTPKPSSSLKTERTSRQRYATRDQARADVFDYIERFYNPRRRHSLLDYVSPVQFEEITVAV